jgi:nucleotide-binding universal stress UspA family protein
MFERILVALDGSEHANRALDMAIELAQEVDAEISVIHVHSPTAPTVEAPPALLPADAPVMAPSPTRPTTRQKIRADLREAQIDEAEQILKQGELKVKSEGLPVEQIMKEGEVAETIVEVADNEDFDLIVMGARGVSTIKELLLGSVSDDVIRNAPCPVLVTK